MQNSDKPHVKYLAGGLSCMLSSFRTAQEQLSPLSALFLVNVLTNVLP